jgi:hypothetical protein
LEPLIQEIYTTHIETGDVLINVGDAENNSPTIAIWQGVYNDEAGSSNEWGCYTNKIVVDDDISQDVFDQRVRAATFISSLQIEEFRQDRINNPYGLRLCDGIVVSVESDLAIVDIEHSQDIADMTNVLTNGFLQRGINNGII